MQRPPENPIWPSADTSGATEPLVTGGGADEPQATFGSKRCAVSAVGSLTMRHGRFPRGSVSDPSDNYEGVGTDVIGLAFPTRSRKRKRAKNACTRR